MPPERFTCGGCDTTWSGLGRAHCSACHRTFSTAGLFDRHRRLRGESGFCLDPLAMLDHGEPLCLTDGIWRGTARAVGAYGRGATNSLPGGDHAA